VDYETLATIDAKVNWSNARAKVSRAGIAVCAFWQTGSRTAWSSGEKGGNR